MLFIHLSVCVSVCLSLLCVCTRMCSVYAYPSVCMNMYTSLYSCMQRPMVEATYMTSFV